MHAHVAIVIPTYNERATISDLIRRLLILLPGAKVFVVDDNSPDGTAEIVQDLGEKNERVRLLWREKKQGLASAYLDAFARILPDESLRYIVTMDADLSHQPDDILRLAAAADEGHQLVIGSRYVSGGQIQNWNLRRRLLSDYGNRYARLVTRVPVADLTAGLVLYHRELLGRILAQLVKSEGYAYQIEMKYLAYRLGARIKELPIVFRERTDGISKLTKGVVWEGILMPWRLRLSRR